MKEETHVFDEIVKNENVSRIVFLNLDGYESEFNVDMAKYLYKSLMYISFPKESTSKIINPEEEKMRKMEDFKSLRLLRKYFYGGLS